MSDTLERLTQECDVARDKFLRDMHRQFSDWHASGDGHYGFPIKFKAAALDRLCRAHEALERERCAMACGDVTLGGGDILLRANVLGEAERRIRALRAPAPVRPEETR